MEQNFLNKIDTIASAIRSTGLQAKVISLSINKDEMGHIREFLADNCDAFVEKEFNSPSFVCKHGIKFILEGI